MGAKHMKTAVKKAVKKEYGTCAGSLQSRWFNPSHRRERNKILGERIMHSTQRFTPLAALLLVGGLALSPLALAQSPSQPPSSKPAPSPIPPEKRTPQPGDDGLFKQLNLTPEQTQKIRALQTQSRTDLQQRSQTLMQKGKELRDLLDSDAPEAQVRAKFQELQTLQQQFSEAAFNERMAIRSVLTPAQRRQAAELRQREEARIRSMIEQRKQPPQMKSPMK